MNKAVVLLSGGLDSLVSLGYAIKSEKFKIEIALTFDYGQKSLQKEAEASKRICEYYDIKHEIISLDWLRNIANSALVSGKSIPNKDFLTKESCKAVWVPNRNSLFLNIAACYCDSFGYNYIIYGANKDEGGTFPDNTEIFRQKLSDVFEYSTLNHPKIIAPLINYTKDDIVKLAVEYKIPLEMVWSCYNFGEEHCGNCESCYHLKKALLANNCKNYIDILFKENEN